MFDVRAHKLVSDQVDYAELQVIIREAENVLKNQPKGAFVELGCYTGTTSLFLRRILDAYQSDREFHVYDSFSGLPEKVAADNSPAGEQFKAGELKAAKQQLVKNFQQAHLKLPFIHKVWFEELSHGDIPSPIAFAFLDGDFYTSIIASLQVITPHLVPGAVILVDDYANEALPGARKATDTWARQHQKTVRIEKSLGIIRW